MNQIKRSDPGISNTTDFTRTILINASPRKLYEAVTTVQGLKGWWSDDTIEKGGDITVRFGDENFQTLRLLNLTPDQEVVWEWIAQYFPLDGTRRTDEWVGTKVSFDIRASIDGTSTLTFTHIGLTPELVCYDKCNAGWNHFLESLKTYLEIGKGAPRIRGVEHRY
jgi:uncharacterized protein YndB with AHSA1/START domain